MPVPNTCPHTSLIFFFFEGRDFQLVRSCVCWGGRGKTQKGQLWNTRWPAGKISKTRFLDTLKLNYKDIFFASPFECFWLHYFIVISFPVPWHFSFLFVKNYSNIIFLKNHKKLATENISICCFSAATQGLTLYRLLIVWTYVKS